MSAHLHFEIRTVPVDPQDWYPNDRQPKQDGYYDSIEALECDGLIDPSDFIDSHRGEVGLQMEESLTEPIQEMEETSAGGEAMGIDVSDYQGSIDWSQVAAAGYRFAFVKATEGEGWTGDMEARQQNFEANMQGASSAGMLVGAYHFARPDLGNSAEDEARWFVDVAGDYIKPGYLRPVLDIEIGSADLSSWVNEWMETVKSETGVEPLIYTNAYFSSNYLDNSMAQYDLWISHWTYDTALSPNTGIWDSWAFWQYSDMGEVPGIARDVDQDLFRGSESELSNFVIASASIGDQVTLTLYVHEESAYGPVVPGALVTGLDSSGNSFEQTTDNDGYVTITGYSGTWFFSVSADGYETNNWYQEITENDMKDAFLQEEAPGEEGSINCDSVEAESWFERGVAFYDQFEYTEAIDCFDEATQICPQYEEAWAKMGNAYLIGRFGFFSGNNPSEAIRCYDEALNINPENAIVWNNKGTAYNDLGQYNEAIQCYDQAININPQYAGAWYGKGHSQYKQGHYDDALLNIEMAIVLDPEIPDFWQVKGDILAALGSDEAQAAYDRGGELGSIKEPTRKSDGAITYD